MKTVSFVAALLLILALAVLPAFAKKGSDDGGKGGGHHGSGGHHSGGHYESGDDNGGRRENVRHHDNWSGIHHFERAFREAMQDIGESWNRFNDNWDDWDRTWDKWEDKWDREWNYRSGEERPDREYILTSLRELVDRAHNEGYTPVFRQVGHIRDTRIWEENLPRGEYVLYVVGGSHIDEMAVQVMDTDDNLIAEDDEMNATPSVWFDLDSRTTIDITAQVWSYYNSFTNDYVGVLLCRR